MIRCLPAFALALALAGSGCNLLGSSRSPGPVNTVVLVSIDSLRPDHLGAYGYAPPTSPVIDTLAAEGVVFERAYATSSWTLPSHAALLTGRYNDSHGANDDGHTILANVPMLPEALGRHGVRSVGFYSGPYLHPSFGFGRGFEDYQDATSYAWQGLPAGKLMPHAKSHRDVTNPVLEDKVGAWLQDNASGRPTFVFIHMWDVHYDYLAPKSYVDIFDADYSGPVDGTNILKSEAINPEMSRRDREHLEALYDAEIRYTDETLGHLLDMFEQHGFLDNAAVFVVADHGEAFFEHGHTGHRLSLYEEEIRVPMILHLSGRQPKNPRVTQVVSLIDVFATVCGLFQVDCAYDGPGTSLLPFFDGQEPPGFRGDAVAELTLALFGWDQDALVRADDKIIRNNRHGVNRYYDLRGVPFEGTRISFVHKDSTNVPPKAREAATLLDQRLREIAADAARFRRGAKPKPAQLEPATAEHLRSLGYLK